MQLLHATEDGMSSRAVFPTNLKQKCVKEEQLASVSVLAVGDPDEWLRHGNPFPTEEMAFISFAEISENILTQYNPTVVFSPVLASNFDCIDLAILLQQVGYTGSYRAMAKDLPKPELIEREVAHICPRIDFSIVISS